MRTLEEVVNLETAPRVVQLRVLGGFAAAAFLLAAIGIHGLLAFSVSARSREIGVRIALGANARDIMWMVVGRSTMLAIIGVSIGSSSHTLLDDRRRRSCSASIRPTRRCSHRRSGCHC